MIKTPWYVIKDIVYTIYSDLSKSSNIFDRPRELMKVLMWFFIISYWHGQPSHTIIDRI